MTPLGRNNLSTTTLIVMDTVSTNLALRKLGSPYDTQLRANHAVDTDTVIVVVSVIVFVATAVVAVRTSTHPQNHHLVHGHNL